MRKKKDKKSNYERNEKSTKTHRKEREEMSNEEEGRGPMMFPYPMMFDKKMPGFEPGGPMMSMPGMPRMFPHQFPMPGYAPMIRPPPMYPPGMIPPLPNPIEGRMPTKPFVNPKIGPVVKEKDKIAKKQEESGKVIELPSDVISAEIFRSIQLSVKNLQEPLYLLGCKKILTELETKLREKN